MTAPLLVARDVNAYFGSRHVLRDISLSAAPGEVVAIAGENGGGKTTLLRILAGLAGPESGQVWRGGAWGYSPQDALLYGELTPAEHFRLFGKALRLSGDEILRRSEMLLVALGFHDDRARPARQLSGGTRQKLNLALALLGDPPILLLDEPYNGFDTPSYERFWLWLEGARAAGKCVLMVSHLVIDASRFDRVFSLVGGRIR